MQHLFRLTNTQRVFAPVIAETAFALLRPHPGPARTRSNSACASNTVAAASSTTSSRTMGVVGLGESAPGGAAGQTTAGMKNRRLI
jgi:hypothetical protein